MSLGLKGANFTSVGMSTLDPGAEEWDQGGEDAMDAPGDYELYTQPIETSDTEIDAFDESDDHRLKFIEMPMGSDITQALEASQKTPYFRISGLPVKLMRDVYDCVCRLFNNVLDVKCPVYYKDPWLDETDTMYFKILDSGVRQRIVSTLFSGFHWNTLGTTCFLTASPVMLPETHFVSRNYQHSKEEYKKLKRKLNPFENKLYFYELQIKAKMARKWIREFTQIEKTYIASTQPLDTTDGYAKYFDFLIEETPTDQKAMIGVKLSHRLDHWSLDYLATLKDCLGVAYPIRKVAEDFVNFINQEDNTLRAYNRLTGEGSIVGVSFMMNDPGEILMAVVLPSSKIDLMFLSVNDCSFTKSNDSDDVKYHLMAFFNAIGKRQGIVGIALTWAIISPARPKQKWIAPFKLFTALSGASSVKDVVSGFHYEASWNTNEIMFRAPGLNKLLEIVDRIASVKEPDGVVISTNYPILCDYYIQACKYVMCVHRWDVPKGHNMPTHFDGRKFPHSTPDFLDDRTCSSQEVLNCLKQRKEFPKVAIMWSPMIINTVLLKELVKTRFHQVVVITPSKAPDGGIMSEELKGLNEVIKACSPTMSVTGVYPVDSEPKKHSFFSVVVLSQTSVEQPALFWNSVGDKVMNRAKIGQLKIKLQERKRTNKESRREIRRKAKLVKRMFKGY